jgi:hypothetical protein
MTLTRWRKSSYSGNQGECVELAHTLDAVRDSKNSGPALSVCDLREFLRDVKAGRFDR